MLLALIEVQESDHLINHALSQEHAIVITIMWEFGVKADHEFTKETNKVEHYLKGITENRIYLKATQRQGGSYTRKLEHLDKYVPKISSYLKDHTLQNILRYSFIIINLA